MSADAQVKTENNYTTTNANYDNDNSYTQEYNDDVKDEQDDQNSQDYNDQNQSQQSEQNSCDGASVDCPKYIRLRGLPWSATHQEILDFLKDVTVVNGSKGIHLVTSRWDGKNTGEAYVELQSQQDVDTAEKLNKGMMGHRYIEVFTATSKEAKEAMRKTGSHGMSEVVKLRGLPYSVTEQQVEEFFHGLDILPDREGILFVMDKRGRPTGEAFVRFESQDDCEQALKRNREKIGHRYIEIFRSSLSELRRASNGNGRPGPYDLKDRGSNRGGGNNDFFNNMMGGGGGGGNGGRGDWGGNGGFGVGANNTLGFNNLPNFTNSGNFGNSFGPSGNNGNFGNFGNNGGNFGGNGGGGNFGAGNNGNFGGGNSGGGNNMAGGSGFGGNNRFNNSSGNFGNDFGDFSNFGNNRNFNGNNGGNLGAGGMNNYITGNNSGGGGGGSGNYGGNFGNFGKFGNNAGGGGGGGGSGIMGGGNSGGAIGGGGGGFNTGGMNMNSGAGSGGGNFGPIGDGRGDNEYYTIHMRGLPYSSFENDVFKFFEPVRPANVRIIYNKRGLHSGTADAFFETYEDAEVAMRRHREPIGSRYIELFFDGKTKGGNNGGGGGVGVGMGGGVGVGVGVGGGSGVGVGVGGGSGVGVGGGNNSGGGGGSGGFSRRI